MDLASGVSNWAMDGPVRAATAVAIALFLIGGTPLARADPTNDDYENIFGLVTPDEEREIWVSGQATCVELDRADEASPPLTTQGVIPVIEGYRAEGWDLESANDIVWESVEGRCPDYLEAVKRAVRSYGDPS
jgi:hypothetical protein